MGADDGDEVRTDLAVERTMLAWWRTGLASLAVAIGVGRLLPELTTEQTTWPYVVLGLGFAVYALALFGYGIARGPSTGGWPPAPVTVVAAAGTLLAVATVVLIATT